LTNEWKALVVSTINSYGDTLDDEECREMMIDLGADPDWLENPPAWVDEYNEANKNRYV